MGGEAKGGPSRRRSRPRRYFDIFIVVKEYSWRRRTADRPEDQGCWPVAQGSQPIRSDRPPEVREAGRRGRGLPTTPRRGNDAGKRAWRIGVGLQASWISITPMRSTESSSIASEPYAGLCLHLQLFSRRVGLLPSIRSDDPLVGNGRAVHDPGDGFKLGGGAGADGPG